MEVSLTAKILGRRKADNYAPWQRVFVRQIVVEGVFGISLIAWALDRSDAPQWLSISAFACAIVFLSTGAWLAWVWVPRSWREDSLSFDASEMKIHRLRQPARRVDCKRISLLQRRSRWYVLVLTKGRPVFVPTYLLGWTRLMEWIEPVREDIEIVDLRPGRAARIGAIWATAVVIASALAYATWTLVAGESGLFASTLSVALVIWIIAEARWHYLDGRADAPKDGEGWEG